MEVQYTPNDHPAPWWRNGPNGEKAYWTDKYYDTMEQRRKDEITSRKKAQEWCRNHLEEHTARRTANGKRTAARRDRVAITCGECEEEFYGHHNSKYCKPCRDKIRTIRLKEYKDAERERARINMLSRNAQPMTAPGD